MCGNAQTNSADKSTLTAGCALNQPTKEMIMSKGQRGNKEAKKQKKSPSDSKPLVPDGALPAVSVAPNRMKKK